jgi:hypothetical protein
MREFKDSITGNDKDDQAKSRPEITSAAATTPDAAPAQREPASQRPA